MILRKPSLLPVAMFNRIYFATDVVVQPHRFDILEDIGCYPVVYNTLPAYFLYFMWPVVLGMISFCYSGEATQYPLCLL